MKNLSRERKKPYRSPSLIRYGDLKKLTAGTKGCKTEGDINALVKTRKVAG